jgi:hypothetical protein
VPGDGDRRETRSTLALAAADCGARQSPGFAWFRLASSGLCMTTAA